MPFHRILARSGNRFESFKVSIISLELIHRLLLMCVEATLSSLVLRMVVARFVNSIVKWQFDRGISEEVRHFSTMRPRCPELPVVIR